jgi:predicted AAA+ superfamily ATPase
MACAFYLCTRGLLTYRKATVFFFGARGTGKTKLLNSFSPASEALYIDLLSGTDYLRYSTNPDEFKNVCIGSKKPWIVVDEIQKAPSLLDAVHQLIESHGLLFALTGFSTLERFSIELTNCECICLSVSAPN